MSQDEGTAAPVPVPPTVDTAAPPVPEPPVTVTPDPPAQHDSDGDRIGALEAIVANLTEVVQSVVKVAEHSAQEESPTRVPWTHWGDKK